MTTAHPSPDDPSSPDPASTAGLEPGGGVRPGDTPPGEGSMSGASPDATRAPNVGPVSGNRTPMIIALTAMAVVVVLLVLGTAAGLFTD